jgi:DNA mismatch endonuclease, patch repair protein
MMWGQQWQRIPICCAPAMGHARPGVARLLMMTQAEPAASIHAAIAEPKGAGRTSPKGSSWASSSSVRAVMRGNRKRDTRPELAVRRATHRLGLRFRVCRRPVPEIAGTADLVFAVSRVAVFVDGCFWHGCPHHFRAPGTNSDYWAPKLERNRRRDALVDQALETAGWTVIRVWEHEDPEVAAAKIQGVVRAAHRPSADRLGARRDRP